MKKPNFTNYSLLIVLIGYLKHISIIKYRIDEFEIQNNV